MTDKHEAKAKRFLIKNGYTGIYYPGECGCYLGDLMPCLSLDFDRATGIPLGCKPGYKHEQGSDWIVSNNKEPPSNEDFQRIIDEC